MYKYVKTQSSLITMGKRVGILSSAARIIVPAAAGAAVGALVERRRENASDLKRISRIHSQLIDLTSGRLRESEGYRDLLNRLPQVAASELGAHSARLSLAREGGLYYTSGHNLDVARRQAVEDPLIISSARKNKPAIRAAPGGTRLVVPLIHEGENRGVLELFFKRTARVPAKAALGELGSEIAHSIDHGRAIEKQTFLDSLTALGNRKRLDRDLDRVIVSGGSRGKKNSLVYFDLDFFKVINDTYGHQKGDIALREFGSVMSRTARKMGVDAHLYRHGGDEFSAILKDSGRKAAEEYAMKVRENLERHCTEGKLSKAIFPSPDESTQRGNPLFLSLSFGIAQGKTANDGAQKLKERADNRLYLDKAARSIAVDFAEKEIGDFIQALKRNPPKRDLGIEGKNLFEQIRSMIAIAHPTSLERVLKNYLANTHATAQKYRALGIKLPKRAGST